ncbi:MAG: DUF4038 domain-containing protein [Fimbriimonadaceae bacterium]|nr:DUF4038 domain-containing protein [Fimbriimonadaceae bacterium]
MQQVVDFLELDLAWGRAVGDPFRSLRSEALVQGPEGRECRVRGFIATQDGSVVRFRLPVLEPGEHRYEVWAELDGERRTVQGGFLGGLSHPDGILQADGRGFRWSRSGRPFFWNSTTCYLMPGLSDEARLSALDRLSELEINRIRVAFSPSRQLDGSRWAEPAVTPAADFTFLYSPFLCARPEDVRNPGFDVTRFNLDHWRRFDRLLAEAGERGIIVQVIFFLDAQEEGNYPFDRARVGDDPDEDRCIESIVAWYGARWNVEWCVTNEWELFRPDEWADLTGPKIRAADPLGHMISVHGHGRFPYRSSDWCTHALFQIWDSDGGRPWAERSLQEQAETGRMIPQVNEEFGYEDHYPKWGEDSLEAPGRSADTRLLLAAECVFAGCWATTGEWTGGGAGGWINGSGERDDLLMAHRRLKSVLEDTGDFSRLEPGVSPDGTCQVLRRDDLVLVLVPEGTPEPSLDLGDSWSPWWVSLTADAAGASPQIPGHRIGIWRPR